MSAVAFSKGGQIIATASNQRIMGQDRKFSIHCEEALIRKLEKLNAFRRFKGITIFVMRINKFGIAMAKPCRNCKKLLFKYNVGVLFTNNDGKIKRLMQ
jgi:hypothetical protein